MDFKTKRKSKRIYKNCKILTIILIIGFFAGIVCSGIFRSDTLFISSFITMIIAFVCAVIGSYHSDKRIVYKRNIDVYRQSKYFQIILSLLIQKDFDQARFYYNNFIKHNIFRDFLFPFYVNSLLHSNNSNDVEKGQELLMEIRKIHNPDTVFHTPETCPVPENIMNTVDLYLRDVKNITKK